MMQAVVLAGGRGVRLRPLTYQLPKPMASVNGRPFLWHQLMLLRRNGIREVVLLVGYRGEQIREYFGDGGALQLRLSYSFEPEPMGTGGGLRLALPLLGEEFVLVNGDTYLPEDYGILARAFRGEGAPALLVVYGNEEDTSVPNNIALDEEGYVVCYKKGEGWPGLKYANAGVLFLRRELVTLLPPVGASSLEEELFPCLISGRKLRAYVTPSRFYDIGTPERLRQLAEVLA